MELARLPEFCKVVQEFCKAANARPVRFVVLTDRRTVARAPQTAHKLHILLDLAPPYAPAPLRTRQCVLLTGLVHFRMRALLLAPVTRSIRKGLATNKPTVVNSLKRQ